MLLTCSQLVLGGGHRGPQYHPGRHHSGRSHCSWNSWDTFGAVCAGILGAGLIAAAFSDWNRGESHCYNYSPCPPPPPPPRYQRPIYYVPVYR